MLTCNNCSWQDCSLCSMSFSMFVFFFLSISHSYAGLSLRYSLTLGSFYSAGQQMRRKLMAVLRLRSHALFLDLKVRKIMVPALMKTTFIRKFSTKELHPSKRLLTLLSVNYAARPTDICCITVKGLSPSEVETKETTFNKLPYVSWRNLKKKIMHFDFHKSVCTWLRCI